MTIIEVKKRRVNLGSTKILINDVGLGGIRIYTSLKLPIHTDIKYKFTFQFMRERFEIEGNLIWKDEDLGDTSYYGVEFKINQSKQDHLAEIINKMSTLHHLNQTIPDTDFVLEDAYLYLKKYVL